MCHINVTAAATTPIGLTITKVFSQVTDGLKSVIVSSNAEIATQTEARNVDAIKATKRYEAQQAQRPAIDGCGAQSQAAYSQSVGDISRALSSGLKAGGRSRAGNAPTAADQATLTDAIHKRDYCDPLTTPGGCNDVTIQSNARSEPMAAADQKAQSLFSGAGKDGRTPNLTFDPKQLLAGQKFVANVIDSTDSPRKLSPAEYDTPEGKRYEGLRIVNESKMSLSRDTLLDILNERQAVPNSTAVLAAIKDGSPAGGGAYIADREAKVRLHSPSGNISPLELMDIEVGRRVDNPKWYEEVNTNMNSESLLKEQTMMLAMMMKMQYLQLRRGEITTSLAAVQAAEATKANMGGKLQAAENELIRGVARQGGSK